MSAAHSFHMLFLVSFVGALLTLLMEYMQYAFQVILVNSMETLHVHAWGLHPLWNNAPRTLKVSLKTYIDDLLLVSVL